jgi:hypothetical protein
MIWWAQRSTHIPSENDQDRSHRRLLDEALEALLSFAVSVGESLVADLDEVSASGYSSSDFFRSIRDGPAHLFGQLLPERIFLGIKKVQGLLHNGLTVLERRGSPCPESL